MHTYRYNNVDINRIHHIEKMQEKCIICNDNFMKFWYDKKEKNGRSETMYGFEGKRICADCKAKNNNNRPPLSLKDLNEIRKRNITHERYYKEHGY